ncbi:hypothetical protein HCN44_009913 [Aphidius gifuensis]|uniref:Uncharacterized protein n=1 Tax=Aphidius gifuensis TaxID=684658 RepID=A0A835CU60_APHGI|nr:hypothetical protein HCN44_009913 [Aphidius gifuensis]
MSDNFRDRCGNPFNIDSHISRIGLRKLSENLKLKWGINSNYLVCSRCRKQLSEQQPMHQSESDEDDETRESEKEDLESEPGEDIVDIIDEPVAGCSQVSKSISIHSNKSSAPTISIESKLPTINAALAVLENSPIPQKKLKLDPWVENKVDKIAANLKRTLGLPYVADNKSSDLRQDGKHFRELIEKLKDKFHANDTTKNMKIQILTLLPSDWSLRKIAEIMDTTKHMAQVSRHVIEKRGILSSGDARQAL